MGNRIYLISLIVFAAFFSCRKGMEDCTNKPGAETLIIRKLSRFDKIRIGDRFDVAIVQDTSRIGEVELFGAPEITGGIVTRVENGQLTVEDKNHCKWVWQMAKRLKVTLYVDSLSRIELTGNVSLVSTDTLHLDALFVDHRSSGHQYLTLDIRELNLDHREGGTFNLFGKAQVFVPTIYETGKLDARFFPVNHLYIYHYGINRADVNALIDLSCRTENKGDTYYHFQPSGTLEVYGRGPGKLIRAF